MNATKRSIRECVAATEKNWIRSSDEHHRECSRPDQRGRSEINFKENQREQSSDDRQRNSKAEQRMTGCLLITREPPGEKKYRGEFRDLRWLKTNRPESNPATRAVDPHSDVRNETKYERDRCNAEPNPPRALPEMVIDQRRRDANSEAHSKPERLVLEKKVGVAMAILGKSAGAEKHHDADDEQPKHRNEQEVSASPIHDITGSFSMFSRESKAFVRSSICAGRRCD